MIGGTEVQWGGGGGVRSRAVGRTAARSAHLSSWDCSVARCVLSVLSVLSVCTVLSDVCAMQCSHLLAVATESENAPLFGPLSAPTYLSNVQDRPSPILSVGHSHKDQMRVTTPALIQCTHTYIRMYHVHCTLYS